MSMGYLEPLVTYCLVALLGDFVTIRACDDSEALYGDPVALRQLRIISSFFVAS